MTEEKHQAAADQAPSAQSAFGGWMGIATAPLGGSAHPHPHGLTGGAQQKPVGSRQRHSWGWLAVSTGERRRKLRLSYFLSPAQKRVSALLGETLLHYHPIWMGGDNVAVGAIITLSPTHSRRQGVCPARLIRPADGCRTKRGANEMTAGDRESRETEGKPYGRALWPPETKAKLFAFVKETTAVVKATTGILERVGSVKSDATIALYRRLAKAAFRSRRRARGVSWTA